MLINYPQLTLNEIAIFWAREDAAGSEIIEKRRLAEIRTIFRNAWQSGELTTTLTIKAAQPAQNWLDRWTQVVSDRHDIAANQARKALDVLHWQIDESQLDRKTFLAWLRARTIEPPTFWTAPATSDSPPEAVEGPATQIASDGSKVNTGPRPYKSARLRANLEAALLSGELSIQQLHGAPMKLFASQFGVSRPTATKVVELLRKENPYKPGSNS